MNQSLSRRHDKESLSEVMRRSVSVRDAASILNDCMVLTEGKPPPTIQQERVALAVYNKMVPAYAALVIEIQDSRPTSVHDLNAMLISSGLDALTGESQVIDSVGDSDSATEESERGAPPDAEA
jgi:hypothetical protein